MGKKNNGKELDRMYRMALLQAKLAAVLTSEQVTLMLKRKDRLRAFIDTLDRLPKSKGTDTSRNPATSWSSTLPSTARRRYPTANRRLRAFSPSGAHLGPSSTTAPARRASF